MVRNVRTPAGSNPEAVPCSRAKLLTSRPAPTSRITRDGDLGRDQRAAQPAPPADRGPARFPQDLVERHARDLRRGQEAEDDPAPSDTAIVKARTGQLSAASCARGRLAGSRASTAFMASQATASPAAPPTRPSTQVSVRSWRTRRNRSAPSEARTASSRRRASPRASSRLARFAQARSEHEGDRAEQHDEHGARGPQEVRAQRHEGGAEVSLLVLVRVLLDEARDDDPHLRACGLERHSRRQARHRLEVVPSAPVARGRAVQRQRHEHLRAACPEIGRQEQAGRSDADDLERLAVDVDGAPDDGRVRVEPADPESVGEDRDVAAGFALLVREEVASEGGRHAEDGQQVRGHGGGGQALRLRHRRRGSRAENAEAAICRVRLRSW